VASDSLWRIVSEGRNGILATVGDDGSPQLSNIFYLADSVNHRIRFSTTTDRVKGHNLRRDPRGVLHVPGKDFFNFAVVAGPVDLAIAIDPDDKAVEMLLSIHSALSATFESEGFGNRMVADHRMAVELTVDRIYGQILDR
jgi:PPOX class probable F420-dependent enzyme